MTPFSRSQTLVWFRIRTADKGGVYLFCKPQYILEALPTGLVAKGLWGNFSPLLTLLTPSLQIARVYVLGRQVNFLSRIHRYADIRGICLLLRIVMAELVYTRLVDCYLWLLPVSGCWFTQEMVPLSPCGQHRQGQDWHLGLVRANKLTEQSWLLLLSVSSVNIPVARIKKKKRLPGLWVMQYRAIHADTRCVFLYLCESQQKQGMDRSPMLVWVIQFRGMLTRTDLCAGCHTCSGATEIIEHCDLTPYPLKFITTLD